MGISNIAARRMTPTLARQHATPQAFSAASSRLQELASALARTGNHADGKLMQTAAVRLSHAAQLHADGHTHAAFQMLHARRKAGLANPGFQKALALGNRAEGLLATFNPKVPTARHMESFKMPGSGLNIQNLQRFLDKLWAWFTAKASA